VQKLEKKFLVPCNWRINWLRVTCNSIHHNDSPPAGKQYKIKKKIEYIVFPLDKM